MYFSFDQNKVVFVKAYFSFFYKEEVSIFYKTNFQERFYLSKKIVNPFSYKFFIGNIYSSFWKKRFKINFLFKVLNNSLELQVLKKIYKRKNLFRRFLYQDAIHSRKIYTSLIVTKMNVFFYFLFKKNFIWFSSEMKRFVFLKGNCFRKFKTGFYETFFFNFMYIRFLSFKFKQNMHLKKFNLFFKNYNFLVNLSNLKFFLLFFFKKMEFKLFLTQTSMLANAGVVFKKKYQEYNFKPLYFLREFSIGFLKKFNIYFNKLDLLKNRFFNMDLKKEFFSYKFLFFYNYFIEKKIILILEEKRYFKTIFFFNKKFLSFKKPHVKKLKKKTKIALLQHKQLYFYTLATIFPNKHKIFPFRLVYNSFNLTFVQKKLNYKQFNVLLNCKKNFIWKNEYFFFVYSNLKKGINEFIRYFYLSRFLNERKFFFKIKHLILKKNFLSFKNHINYFFHKLKKNAFLCNKTDFLIFFFEKSKNQFIRLNTFSKLLFDQKFFLKNLTYVNNFVNLKNNVFNFITHKNSFRGIKLFNSFEIIEDNNKYSFLNLLKNNLFLVLNKVPLKFNLDIQIIYRKLHTLIFFFTCNIYQKKINSIHVKKDFEIFYKLKLFLIKNLFISFFNLKSNNIFSKTLSFFIKHKVPFKMCQLNYLTLKKLNGFFKAKDVIKINNNFLFLSLKTIFFFNNTFFEIFEQYLNKTNLLLFGGDINTIFSTLLKKKFCIQTSLPVKLKQNNFFLGMNFLSPFVLFNRNFLRKMNMLFLNLKFTKRNFFVNLIEHWNNINFFSISGGETKYEGRLKKTKEAGFIVGCRMWFKLNLIFFNKSFKSLRYLRFFNRRILSSFQNLKNLFHKNILRKAFKKLYLFMLIKTTKKNLIVDDCNLKKNKIFINLFFFKLQSTITGLKKKCTFY